MGRGTLSELIAGGIGAFNRGDHQAVLDLLTEDVEWKRVDGLPDEGDAIRGKDGVREFLKPEVFDRARITWRVETWRRREDAERSSGLKLGERG